MKKSFIIGISFWAIIVTIALTVIFISDTAKAGDLEKVTICHATSSDKNPYVLITIDPSSIDNEKNQYLNGHGDHEKDIIPPFTYGESSFEGRNWDEVGIGFWNKDCNIPDPDPTPTPTPTPEPTPTPTPVDPTPTPTEPPPYVPPVEPTHNPPKEPAIIENPSESYDTIIPEIVESVPSTPIIEDPPQLQELEKPVKVPVPTSIPAGGGGTIKVPSLK